MQHRLYEMIDARLKLSLQMDAADRKQRLDEIKAELSNSNGWNARISTRRAREGATLIQHRPNVDVRALLGLTVCRMASAA